MIVKQGSRVEGARGSQEYDLQSRLTDFALRVIDVAEALPSSMAAKHIAGQLLRCGTAPPANYAEALGAESRKDFVHKMRIGLKELRETLVWLKMIERRPLIRPSSKMQLIIRECNELIAIFAASVGTARKNIEKGRP